MWWRWIESALRSGCGASVHQQPFTKSAHARYISVYTSHAHTQVQERMLSLAREYLEHLKELMLTVRGVVVKGGVDGDRG